MPRPEPADLPAPDFSALTFTPSRDPFAPGLLAELDEPPRRVIVLRASRIGDFINATPAFKSLRQALPEAEIDVLTLPMLADLARRCPSIDHTYLFPGYPGLADQFFDPARTLAFMAEMQARRYDLAIQMQGTGVYSNPFMLMLGARRTAGFVRPGDPPGRLDAALPWPEQGHETRRVLALTEFLGAPTVDPLPDFHLRPADHEDARDRLAPIAPPWIGIHTAARDQTRRWPLERFAAAAASLQRKHGGTVVILGEERDRAETENALAAAQAPYLNLAGYTSIPVTGAILKRLAVFLTNDTGPAHIAYAVGAPTVAIFGGGDPGRNGPLQGGPQRVLAHPVPCRPCETGQCPIGLRCLVNITVDQVVSTAEEIMRR